MTLGTRQKGLNMYTAPRCRVDMTRFDAAIDLHLSDRTLARYELGEAIPPPETVLAMSRVYRDPLLPIKHCAEVCPLGAAIHDRVEEEVHNFSAAVCGLISGHNSLKEALHDLARMASGGKITPDENEIRSRVEKNLKEFKKRITTAQIAVALQMISVR